MAFQVSPGVNISEIDLTTRPQAISTAVGAIAGVFRWGPVGKLQLVDSEPNLVARYGKPTNINAETFFTAANFLSYSNALQVSRAAVTTGFSNSATGTLTSGNSQIALDGVTSGISVGDAVFGTGVPDGAIVNSSNSTVVNISSSATVSGSATLNFFANSYTFNAIANSGVAKLSTHSVKNSDHFEDVSGNFEPDVHYIAKYPGSLGNSLRISQCDNATQYNSTIAVSNSTIVDGFDVTKSFTANTEIVDGSLEFITFTNSGTEALNDDDVVTYTGATAIGGLTSGDSYFVVAANTSGVKLANTAGGNAIDLTPTITSETHTLARTAGADAVAGGGSLSITVGSSVATVVVANSSSMTASQANIAATTIVNSIAVGDIVEIGNSSIGRQYLKVKSIGTPSVSGGNSSFTVTFEESYKLSTNYSAGSIDRKWEFFNLVDRAPGTSDTVTSTGRNVVDEVSVVIIDEDGAIGGVAGTVLEVFANLSRATDSKTSDGSDNYYKSVINDFSRYVWSASDRTTAASATSGSVANSTSNNPMSYSLIGGRDGVTEADVSIASLATAYDLFADAESVDVSLILTGKSRGGTNGEQLPNYLIDNIAEVRKDCVVLVSPQKEDVYGVSVLGTEASNIITFRNSLRSTSYSVLDSGYKYQYDKYNDVYRYIPLNGDVAGITARTDDTRDPWFSPAGFNRGQVKNLVKLAYNPSKADRDLLYKSGVNSVVSFPGQGTVLFGDKTLLAKSSAFDRINVRRLFITLEKTIATAANFTLFEFNDEFTRAQFKNLVEPFLRDVQGRRGIYDFKVVCDESNNTAEVIDGQRFVGDIYIKPAKSINFIQLNFVAVRTGVEFSEIVGNF
jgi:phage tail sheath protein FI